MQDTNSNSGRISDQEPTAIKVVAPSTVAVGEPFIVRLKVLTDPFYVGADCYRPMPSGVGRYNTSPRGIRYMDNVPPIRAGSIHLAGGDGFVGPAELPLREGSGPYPGDARPICTAEGISFAVPGTKYIRVTHTPSGVCGVSNPVQVLPDPPAERLYWGDIHCQTFFSDGLRCPEELYLFARDEAFLDVFSLADHAESLSDRQWEYFTAVTNDFNEDHRFVTLVGLEWTSKAWGHRNIHYPGDSGPCLRADDPVYGQLPNLYQAARAHGALVVPHHSANARMGVDWSLGHDPQVERLVEIYSVWGNSERPADAGNPRPIAHEGGEAAGQHVIDALKMGRRYGFIAGGDTHDGRPGDELHNLQEQPPGYRFLWRQGIMGIWARELTREGIFEALWYRRTYATTNVRVLLKFSIAGHPMGSEVKTRGSPDVFVEVRSEVPIRRCDIVCNGHDCLSQFPNEMEVNWRVPLPTPDTHEAWYYARVTRQDGEMAWSSPIWVTFLS